LKITIFSIDIKKCSLSILKSLVLSRDDAKIELLENGVLDQCLSYIQSYPEDDIDNEIVGLALDLLSQSTVKQTNIRNELTAKKA
jgi:hypothetical protein